MSPNPRPAQSMKNALLPIRAVWIRPWTFQAWQPEKDWLWKKIPCENTTAFSEQIFIVSHMFCHMVDPGVAVSQVRLEAFCGVSRSILKMLPFWDGLVEISSHQLDLLQCLNWEAVCYPIPRNIPLKNAIQMDSLQKILYIISYIYIVYMYIISYIIFFLFTDTHIYLYYAYIESDLGG